MKILLDTHALIWFVEDNVRLSQRAKSLIQNIDNEVYVSVVTWYEVVIKMTLGKLQLPDSFAETMRKTRLNEIKTIAISDLHLITYQQLPLRGDHKDPFDRMLIATARAEKLLVVSSDPKFLQYEDNISIIW